MASNDNLTAVATLIAQQTDQLWSIAMAVIVAEIVTVCSFFRDPSASWKWQLSEWLLLVSILFHGGSLFFGYLTKGALIEMVQAGAGPNSRQYYNAAADASLWQFFLLVGGITLFVIVFWMKRSEVSGAILGGKK